MAKTFPKPLFDDVLAHYRVESISVHDCPSIYAKDEASQSVSVNTCALRASEALCLANGLVKSRAAISKLARRGDGKALLLGPYGYAANLCPHGIARGARDLAHFLRQEWGKPSLTWKAQPGGSAPSDIQGKTGMIGFIKIPGYSGQGHIDVWNRTDCVGSGYWNSQDIWFWELA